MSSPTASPNREPNVSHQGSILHSVSHQGSHQGSRERRPPCWIVSRVQKADGFQRCFCVQKSALKYNSTFKHSFRLEWIGLVWDWIGLLRLNHWDWCALRWMHWDWCIKIDTLRLMCIAIDILRLMCIEIDALMHWDWWCIEISALRLMHWDGRWEEEERTEVPLENKNPT